MQILVLGNAWRRKLKEEEKGGRTLREEEEEEDESGEGGRVRLPKIPARRETLS